MTLGLINIEHFWLTPEVIKEAQAIYHERFFGRLPSLADALERAGCTNAAILEHCRSGVEDVNGCWVVDLLLGRSIHVDAARCTSGADIEDDCPHDIDRLRCLAVEMAALVRQYARAAEAADPAAQEVELQAICDRVCWFLYYHLDLRIGMGSDNWVWRNADDENYLVEWRAEHRELRTRGRIWCSLPEGRRQWSEPFTATISHSLTTAELSDYEIWFGNRETLIDLTAVRSRIANGEVFHSPVPESDGEWAFVFRMGEYT